MFLLIRNSADLLEKSSRYERHTSSGLPRILILGDSTGAGAGVEDPKSLIAGRFGTDFSQAYIQNESVND